MNDRTERLRHALVAQGVKSVEVALVDGQQTVCVKALFTRGQMSSNFWFYFPESRMETTDPVDLAAEVASALRMESDSVFDQLCIRRS